MDTVSIFCAIDDFCKLFEPHWQQYLLAAASKQRNRKPRLCPSEVLTIIVGFHLSGYRTFKGYYTQHVLPHQLHYFPRLVSYQLPDGKLIRVLTDRFDLSALSVAQLYKERWTIENWWKWVKQMFKIKRLIGESENALPVQIVSAFVIDLLLRPFKHSSGFTSSLYEFVSSCHELSLVSLKEFTNSPLRRALETILKLFDNTRSVKSPLQLTA